jgi:hypothetical protein
MNKHQLNLSGFEELKKAEATEGNKQDKVELMQFVY